MYSINFTLFQTIILIFCTVTTTVVSKNLGILSEDGFCYEEDEDCGPSRWSGVCNVNNLVHQSPIDITVNPFQTPENPLKILTFTNYETDFGGFTILNNGHTIQLKFNPTVLKAKVAYELGGRSGYIFEQMHFHWGQNLSVGSEHAFNGTRTPMEIHLVHYSDQYADFNEALESNDTEALTVIGIPVIVSPTPNLRLQNVVEALKNVSDASQLGVSVRIYSSFKLSNFLPSVLDYFGYDGSLTTPPCYEEVKWTFLANPISLSADQIAEFGKVAGAHGHEIHYNYRPLQELGDRTVQFYRAEKGVGSCAHNNPNDINPSSSSNGGIKKLIK